VSTFSERCQHVPRALLRTIGRDPGGVKVTFSEIGPRLTPIPGGHAQAAEVAQSGRAAAEEPTRRAGRCGCANSLHSHERQRDGEPPPQRRRSLGARPDVRRSS